MATKKKPVHEPAEFKHINLLNVGVVVALFLVRSEYAAAMREIGIPEEHWHSWPDAGCAQVAAYVNGANHPGKHVVVSLGETKGMSGIDIASVLVHEAVHVWQAYAEHIGERSPADEQSAYAIQAIAEFLMNDFLRQGGLNA